MSSDLPTMTRDDLWLPGDCLGGAVLEGWQGPVWGRGADHEWWGTRLYSGERGGHMVAVGADRIEWWPESALHVYCTQTGKRDRPEVRDRLRRVLAAGKRCGACSGDGGWRSHASDGPVHFPGVCPACHGTGYTRPPHDLDHVTAAELRGAITPTAAAGILWCSVLRVEAGVGPVRGVLGRWMLGTHGFTGEPVRYLTTPKPINPVAALWASRRRWRLLLEGPRGPCGETDLGHEQAAADAAALSAGYALLTDGGILLPHPDGPRLLEFR